jgi:hypothetical protein
LGVTIETKSMRWSAGRLSSSASSVCQSPWLRSSARPRSRPEARALSGLDDSAPAVERHGLAVHGADEGVAAAADHGVAQLAGSCIGHIERSWKLSPLPLGRGLG